MGGCVPDPTNLVPLVSFYPSIQKKKGKKEVGDQYGVLLPSHAMYYSITQVWQGIGPLSTSPRTLN